VSTIFVGEDDGGLALNLGDGAIAKLSGAANLGVELDEEVPRPGDVVGGTDVEDLATVVVLLRWTKIGKDLLFLDVDDAVRCCRRGRGCHSSGVDDDNRWLVEDDVVGQKKALLFFFTLGHVGPGHLIVLLLVAFHGPVAFLVAVGTHIIVPCLALAFSPCLVASVPTTVVIPTTTTSPEDGSGPILGLHAGHPLLLHEE
jgi:hypothetical protein